MNQYSVVIVGAGNKGAMSDAPGSGNEYKFLSYAHAVKYNPGFKLMGISDKNDSQAYKASTIWGTNQFCIPEKYCEECEEHFYHEVDVFIVANPDDCHCKTLKIIADFNPKLVICEKPLCTDLEQARGIVELYKEKGIPMLLDYTRRFIPEYQQMKAEIDSGRTGNFIKGYCYYNRGTLHTLSHFIDLALWFNGDLDNIIIQEVPTDYRWVFQWGLFYERDFFSEHAVNFVKNPQVSSMYDNHLKYVMENAYEFLEGKEQLRCTAEDGIRALYKSLKTMGSEV